MSSANTAPPDILLCHLRPARKRARNVAIAEALALLNRFNPTALLGGPRSEQGGIFWVAVPPGNLDTLAPLLARLGYTEAVDGLSAASPSDTDVIVWRGVRYNSTRLYQADPEAERAHAPDKRPFLLQTSDGVLRDITGYRGDGGSLSKRGLPTYDAKVLVNLVTPPPSRRLLTTIDIEDSRPSPFGRGAARSAGERGAGTVFLDPFAGIGGLLLEAVASGYTTLSADIDPALRYGLQRIGHHHLHADAAHLPLADNSIDALATEPPYEPSILATVISALREMHRVLKPNARLALLCADHQAATLRAEALTLKFTASLDAPIDRKGTACVLLVFKKDEGRTTKDEN